MELALFFDLAAMGMWIDRISTGAIHSLLQNVSSFLGTFIATLVVSLVRSFSQMELTTT
jgi:hypothetical protein